MIPHIPEKFPDSLEVAQTLSKLRAIRKQLVWHNVIDNGKMEVLASHVLGYIVRPFHQRMIDFQAAAPDTCLQLAPRGFGKSTIHGLSGPPGSSNSGPEGVPTGLGYGPSPGNRPDG